MNSASPRHRLAEEVSSHLESTFFCDIRAFDEVASTNDECKRLAREGAPEGTVVLAGRQSAGRGRLGKVWESPEGGVYESVLLRPQKRIDASSLASFSLAAALAVARAAERMGVEDAGVKWPNDIVTPRGKLAGVLVESSMEDGVVAWLVVGTGLNVVRPATPVPSADYLACSSAEGLVARAAAAVLDEIFSVYETYLAGGFPALREEYMERFMLVGRRVTVKDAASEAPVSGTVRGVDPDGRLLLDVGGDVWTLSVGDVTLGGIQGWR